MFRNLKDCDDIKNYIQLFSPMTLGYTMRLPLKVEARSPSTLTVSWVGNGSSMNSSVIISLYHIKERAYSLLSSHNTTEKHFQFTALDPCTTYAACVEIADNPLFSCLLIITGMAQQWDWDPEHHFFYS